jgi:hypothetical protein
MDNKEVPFTQRPPGEMKRIFPTSLLYREYEYLYSINPNGYELD